MRKSEEKIRKKVVEELAFEKDISETTLLKKINDEVVDCEDSGEKYIRLGSKKRLRKNVFNSIRRMDVLQDYLEDEDVTEIMVNGANQIFVEKKGKLIETGARFSSREKLEDIVQQIAADGNRIVNEASPILDVRLEDGSRVNIVLPPVSLCDGPVVTIRRFPKEPMTIEKLIRTGAITEEAAEFLKHLVKAKYNIFISGGTGSGKTTFLNILSGFIPETDRVITIEDAAELQIQHVRNLVRLESRMANVEGENEVTIRDLIKSALRMRPDRVIIGEVRDAVAIDMLQAMNTGHDGSLSTGHANSARDMIKRLETLVLMGIELPTLAIRSQISSAIDIIVHLGRLRDGQRKILSIEEVLDVKGEEVELMPLFQFEELGEEKGVVLGELKRTKADLKNMEKCYRAGITREELGLRNTANTS